jgi:hypothetical protein
MRCAPRRCYVNAGVAIAGTSLIAVPPVTSPTPAVQARAVQLISRDSADSLLGDGTALIMAAAFLPRPSKAPCSTSQT